MENSYPAKESGNAAKQSVETKTQRSDQPDKDARGRLRSSEVGSTTLDNDESQYPDNFFGTLPELELDGSAHKIHSTSLPLRRQAAPSMERLLPRPAKFYSEGPSLVPKTRPMKPYNLDESYDAFVAAVEKRRKFDKHHANAPWPSTSAEFHEDLFINFFANAQQRKASGPTILSKLLEDSLWDAISCAIRHFLEWIAGDKYEWILDLQEAGCDTEQIINAIKETIEPSRWVLSYEREKLWKILQSYQAQKPFHQSTCAHSDNPARHSGARTDHGKFESFPQDFLNAAKTEDARKLVGECVGLAGVFPPNHMCNFCGQAEFTAGEVEISYGFVSSKVDLEKDARIAVMSQLNASGFSIRSALGVLQSHGLCCDRLTFLAADQDKSTNAITMGTILFEQLFPFLQVLDQSTTPQALLGSRVGGFEIRNMVHAADEVCRCFPDSWLSDFHPGYYRKDMNAELLRDSQLHFLSLLVQMLSMVILSYSQAHTGEICSPLLKEPLMSISLQGYDQYSHRESKITVSYGKLACMGDLVGEKVHVFGFQRCNNKSIDISSAPSALSLEGAPLFASIEDIIDSWGPALLICEPGSRYGERLRLVQIGGGSISLVGFTAKLTPQYHWDRIPEAVPPRETFSITKALLIAGITEQRLCPLEFEACRRSSEPFLEHRGTEADYWKLAERQALFQGGQYVGFQMGTTYSKIKGRSLKISLLDSWALMHDFRVLLQHWGLQVSLCTGVARRVPLRTLIEEPMMEYIDGLNLSSWDTIKMDMRLALRGEIDFTEWSTHLIGDSRNCAVTVITFFLQILQDTGVDRRGKSFRMLWPHKSSVSHIISLKCSKSNLWARVLKDSPSCATFAAVTTKCLEAPNHICKNITSHTWTGQGALLSTAMMLVSSSASKAIPAHWQLKHGQQYWIEREGGDIWVYTTKVSDGDTVLTVKVNRFPKFLSIPRNWEVLRERQDAGFGAEEVVVFGTMGRGTMDGSRNQPGRQFA